MAWQAFFVEQYDVTRVSPTTSGYNGVDAFIQLSWGAQVRATLWFHADDATSVPTNSSFVSGGVLRYYARMKRRQLADVLDLLRNQKPIYFQWNDTTNGAFLATSPEVVGQADVLPDVGTAEFLGFWLLSHPEIADSIKWQTVFQTNAYDVPESAKLPWIQWTAQMRDDLGAAYEQAWAWLHGQADPFHNLGETLAYPPTNISTTLASDTAAPFVAVSEAWAWDLYVRWIGWCLVVELSAWVPWSVKTYTAEQKQVLFDSVAIMSRDGNGVMQMGSANPENANYVHRKDNLGHSLIAPPRWTAAFLELNALRAGTRLDTIVNLLNWARDNLFHYYGGSTYANMEAHWQYRGLPPITRIVDGTTYTGLNQFGHWTAGCHGSTGFLRNVLRAVNIPMHIVRICGHSLAYFMTEGRYLDHGDDPYNLDFKATGLSASELLIDEATYTQRFGANLDNHDDPAACPYIAYQVQVLSGP